MTMKQKVVGVLSLIGVVVLIGLFSGLVDRNNTENWQIKQGVFGSVSIQNKPGWYLKNFATVWTYPRAEQVYFSAKTDEGGNKNQSMRVTFNDGGTADISAMIRYSTATTPEARRILHETFRNNMQDITHAVRAHLTNCVKATGPLMSASEHQSARKAEFTQLVEQQLRNGLYEMRKVEKELKDRTDSDGNAITVYATEIVTTKDGVPKIAQSSPLKKYEIEILQFSITSTDYDKQTLNQFATKKESYLAAEQSKADREKEVQDRLKIVEQGLREKASATAEGNVKKEKAVIAAQLKAEVAKQEKLEAETKASQLLEVAKIKKLESETQANMLLEVAKLNALAAEEKAKAVITLAAAEEERIQKAGAITEKDQILAEIDANARVKIAAEMSKIQTPSTMIIGGKGEDGNGGIMGNMINLLLMRQAGVITTPVQ